MHALPLIRLPFRRFIITVFDRGWTKCSLGMHHVCLIPRARLNRLCARKAVGSALLSIYLPVCVSAYVHVCKGTHKAKTTQIDNDRDADTGTGSDPASCSAQAPSHALPFIHFPFRRFIVTVFDRGRAKASLGMHHPRLLPR